MADATAASDPDLDEVREIIRVHFERKHAALALRPPSACGAPPGRRRRYPAGCAPRLAWHRAHGVGLLGGRCGLVPLAVAGLLALAAAAAAAPLLREGPRVREYFLAAEDVEWDYVPRGRDGTGGLRAARSSSRLARRAQGRPMGFKTTFGSAFEFNVIPRRESALGSIKTH
jgi:hypothetical protein